MLLQDLPGLKGKKQRDILCKEGCVETLVEVFRHPGLGSHVVGFISLVKTDQWTNSPHHEW
jgi:hypothetical protein